MTHTELRETASNVRGSGPAASHPLPPDVHERLRAAHAERQAAAETRTENELKALSARYRSERATMIPEDTGRALREYADRHRLPEIGRKDQAERERFRLSNLAHAQELGVDLGALGRLRAEHRRRFERIVTGARTGQGEVSEPASEHPIVTAATQTFFKPWHGSWDQGSWSSTTDPGSTTWTNTSYWEAHNRVGANIGFNRRPSDNDDGASITHSSGNMVEFVMPRTGGLEIGIGLTRAFGNHFIDTDDEFGPSSCDVWTTESAVAEVYWDWNDWTADSHVERALAQVHASSPEQWVDTNPVPPNTFRSASLYDPSVVFPAGHAVVVYAGVQESVWAHVDDVSVRASVNSAWYPAWITITVR
jgi:hypothetical protein